MSTEIRPFKIEISDAELEDLRRRLAATRWPEPETVEDWSQGIPLSYVQEVYTYWEEKYDWRTREALLNQVGGYDYYGGSRTVDVHIRRIRAKIERHERFIETLRNVGYRFVDIERQTARD